MGKMERERDEGRAKDMGMRGGSLPSQTPPS